MDNRRMEIVAEGDDALELAIRLAWSNRPEQKVTHYRVLNLASQTKYYGKPDTGWHETEWVEDPAGVPTLILLVQAEKDAMPLPYPLGLEETIPFLKGWLHSVAYPEEPDHDGDNDKGWRVFYDKWNKVAGYHMGVIGVQPEWAMYGK